MKIFYELLLFLFYLLTENPPLNKDLRKRKREEEDGERQRKVFQKNENTVLECNIGSANNSQSNSSKNSDSEDESPVDKFRRGCDLPSDLDMGSDNNSSDNDEEEGDDGDWNMMGAALEREFLGLE